MEQFAKFVYFFKITTQEKGEGSMRAFTTLNSYIRKKKWKRSENASLTNLTMMRSVALLETLVADQEE